VTNIKHQKCKFFTDFTKKSLKHTNIYRFPSENFLCSWQYSVNVSSFKTQPGKKTMVWNVTNFETEIHINSLKNWFIYVYSGFETLTDILSTGKMVNFFASFHKTADRCSNSLAYCTFLNILTKKIYLSSNFGKKIEKSIDNLFKKSLEKL